MTKPRKNVVKRVAPGSTRKPVVASPADGAADVAPTGLRVDLRQLIEGARRAAAMVVHAGLTVMYWRIGQRIRSEVLGDQRADYGQQIVATLSRQLAADYGRSFEEKNLRRMLQFADLFASGAIVVTLSRQLSWFRFLVLLPLKDALARDLYAQSCQREAWSVASCVKGFP
jgi:hypothetical protein